MPKKRSWSNGTTAPRRGANGSSTPPSARKVLKLREQSARSKAGRGRCEHAWDHLPGRVAQRQSSALTKRRQEGLRLPRPRRASSQLGRHRPDMAGGPGPIPGRPTQQSAQTVSSSPTHGDRGPDGMDARSWPWRSAVRVRSVTPGTSVRSQQEGLRPRWSHEPFDPGSTPGAATMPVLLG